MPFKDVPIVFISALSKQRIFKALEVATKVYQNRTQRIKTNVLNEVMLPIIQANPPPALNGQYIKIKFCTQLPTLAPSFAFFCNQPQLVKESYRRFVENQMRLKFDFEGVPLQLFFRLK
jgi:GTP-binding protein